MGKKPEYHLSTSMREGIIEIVITGEIEMNAVEKLQNEVIAIEKSMNSKSVLIDVRGIKGRFGPAEAYFRVRNYPPDKPRMDTAVVDLQENDSYETFHEITARNAGLSFKCFTEIDAARSWLKSRQKESAGQAVIASKKEMKRQFR